MKCPNNEYLEESVENIYEIKKLKYHLIKKISTLVNNIIKNNLSEECILDLEVKEEIF